MKLLWQSFAILAWTTLLTGILYPLIVLQLAQVIAPEQAGGSLLVIDGKVRGSVLVGQEFHSDKYFWPRPSASNYATLPSAGSNLGPTSKVLQKLVEERRQHLLQTHKREESSEVPHGLLFASGSGLDPDIMYDAAIFQLKRVAAARNMDTEEGYEKILQLISQAKEHRVLNLFGRDCINVLMLNKLLDEQTSQEKP